MLEMYRRDQFKQDLLIEQCLEVISIEDRLREIDELLEASAAQRREGVGVRCTCGAPIQWGSHFCANCGRPVGEEPVVSCPNCGHALPADAQFCANCGTPAPSASASGDGNGQDDAQTMYEQQAERSGDPWES
jgi:Double zinc ribbon